MSDMYIKHPPFQYWSNSAALVLDNIFAVLQGAADTFKDVKEGKDATETCKKRYESILFRLSKKKWIESN